MICRRCHQLSDDGLNYCPYCGLSFSDDTEVKTEGDSGASAEQNGSGEERERINFDGGQYGQYPYGQYPYGGNPYGQRQAPRAKREKTPFQKALSGFLHAIGYFLLFVVIQNIVFYAMVYAEPTVNFYNNFYGAMQSIDSSSMTVDEYNALYEYYYEMCYDIYVDEVNSVTSSTQYSVASIVSSAATVAVVLIIGKIRKRTFTEHIGLRPIKSPYSYLALPAGAALMIISLFAINVIPFSEEVIEEYNETYSFIGGGSVIAELISVVIFAPICEEIIFRACGYGRLRRGFPVAAAIIMSAFIFAFAHGNLISYVYTFPMGIILAWLYYEYDSIFVPILFHMGFNLMNYIPIPFGESETITSLDVIVLIISAAVFAVCAVLMIAYRPKKKDKSAEGTSGGAEQ
ncbi:MAG: CPBP family intramembrane metalloprotease [Firmicutes bacterium]|nr:CPBP family intramembrane metalloprotease [Bacillota bacterium]